MFNYILILILGYRKKYNNNNYIRWAFKKKIIFYLNVCL